MGVKEKLVDESLSLVKFLNSDSLVLPRRSGKTTPVSVRAITELTIPLYRTGFLFCLEHTNSAEEAQRRGISQEQPCNLP
jgi:hypothetical protein